MARGSNLSDEALSALGVSRTRDEFGKILYTVPCDGCGNPIRTRTYSTERIYKCRSCSKKTSATRSSKVKEARSELMAALGERLGTDEAHMARFEKGALKFGDAYSGDIEKARKAIDKFDSVPEVVACIELLHTGSRVIVHQKVGDFTVDFCLPDEKLVVEVDGSLYHKNADKEYMRDYALKHMLGDGWEVRHIPADAVTKKHELFGRKMKKMLNGRREMLGAKPLK